MGTPIMTVVLAGSAEEYARFLDWNDKYTRENSIYPDDVSYIEGMEIYDFEIYGSFFERDDALEVWMEASNRIYRTVLNNCIQDG